MQNPPLPEIFKLGAKSVSREQVARYYLQSELDKIVTGGGNSLKQDLTDKELWRLLEALSFSYRANIVFHTVSDFAYDWYQVKIPIEFINMTGMNPAVNTVMSKPTINNSPLKFVEYIQEYFAKHPNDDPENLNECRPQTVAPDRLQVLVRERKDKGLAMIDGTHRMLSQIVNGVKVLDTYYGKLNGKEHKPMMGDSIFLLFRWLYQQSQNAQDKKAILQVVKLLNKQSSDGKSAIKTYWTEHGDDRTKTAAKQHLL